MAERTFPRPHLRLAEAVEPLAQHALAVGVRREGERLGLRGRGGSLREGPVWAHGRASPAAARRREPARPSAGRLRVIRRGGPIS